MLGRFNVAVAVAAVAAGTTGAAADHSHEILAHFLEQHGAAGLEGRDLAAVMDVLNAQDDDDDVDVDDEADMFLAADDEDEDEEADTDSDHAYSDDEDDEDDADDLLLDDDEDEDDEEDSDDEDEEDSDDDDEDADEDADRALAFLARRSRRGKADDDDDDDEQVVLRRAAAGGYGRNDATKTNPLRRFNSETAVTNSDMDWGLHYVMNTDPTFNAPPPSLARFGAGGFLPRMRVDGMDFDLDGTRARLPPAHPHETDRPPCPQRRSRSSIRTAP